MVCVQQPGHYRPLLFLESREKYSNSRLQALRCRPSALLAGPQEKVRRQLGAKVAPAGWSDPAHGRSHPEMAPGPLWWAGHLQESPSDLASTLARPDPPDFFVWGYLKSKVYHPGVKTLADLKTSIRKQMRLIKPDLCERVCQEVLKRADVCVSRKGSYVENVL